MRILGLLLSLAVVCSNANAAIILTAGTGTFDAGSGPAIIDIFVRSTTPAADATQGVEFRFDLTQGGRFNTPPGAFGAGFFGENNIVASGSTFATASPFTSSTLSIEYANPQQFLTTDSRVATLSINTTGLGAGTYNIIATNVFSEAAQNLSFNGSFTITAVPEPTSIALLGIAIGGVFGRKVLRARKRARAEVA